MLFDAQLSAMPDWVLVVFATYRLHDWLLLSLTVKLRRTLAFVEALVLFIVAKETEGLRLSTENVRSWDVITSPDTLETIMIIVTFAISTAPFGVRLNANHSAAPAEKFVEMFQMSRVPTVVKLLLLLETFEPSRKLKFPVISIVTLVMLSPEPLPVLLMVKLRKVLSVMMDSLKLPTDAVRTVKLREYTTPTRRIKTNKANTLFLTLTPLFSAD